MNDIIAHSIHLNTYFRTYKYHKHHQNPKYSFHIHPSASSRHQPQKIASSSPSSSISDCNQRCSVDLWRRPLGTDTNNSLTSPVLPPIVALGKFDALHRGHRALAIAASNLGGTPWIVNFEGIAEVLGWPSRLPLVAPCDRARVFKTWGRYCNQRIPSECSIPFQEVRSLSPEAFVELLAKDLRVAGVVVGSNYRFGYKAAGTADTMKELATKSGMLVDIVELVTGNSNACATADNSCEAASSNNIINNNNIDEDVISSSNIREALAVGNMTLAEYYLGRPYRCVMDFTDRRHIVHSISYHNQVPANGRYRVLMQIADNDLDIHHHVGQGTPGEILLRDNGMEILCGYEALIHRYTSRDNNDDAIMKNEEKGNSKERENMTMDFKLLIDFGTDSATLD